MFFMDLHILTQVHGVFMDLHILTHVHGVFHAPAYTYTGPWCFSCTCMYLHRSMVLFLGQDISVDVSETQTAWTDMFYSVMRQLSDP